MNLVWTDKHGKDHLVEEMEYSYIVNCKKFLLKYLSNAEQQLENAWSTSIYVRGDIASYYIEYDIFSLEERIIWIKNWIETFNVEIERRENERE